MKRAMLLLILVGLAGAVGAAERPLRVVTSFYPMHIAALNITQNVPDVELSCLVRPQVGCLHEYHLTPADMKQLAAADVLIANGAGMENFLDEALRHNSTLRVINASVGIEPLHTGAEINPHVWVSPTLHIQQVRNIAEGLAREDAAHAGTYRRNADRYIQSLQALADRMHTALQGLAGRPIVTFHEAFPYFAKEFNLEVAAVIEHEPGMEPSARELAETIRTVRSLGVTALFIDPQYPAKAARTIAKETGATIYTLDPVVTGPLEADAYLKIMERNQTELEQALK